MADRAKKATWKDVELFLMDWRVEINAQFKELREPFQNLPKLQSVPIQVQEQSNGGPGACSEGNPMDLGANSGPRTSNSSANLIPEDQVPAQECPGNLSEEIRREPNDRSSSMGIHFTRESRPKINLEDNLRKLEALAQQHASTIQQWWPSTNQIITESHQEKQFATLAPSNLGLELNLEAKSEEQDREELCSLTENQEIKELQDSTPSWGQLEFADAYDLFDEMSVGVKRSEALRDDGKLDFTEAFASLHGARRYGISYHVEIHSIDLIRSRADDGEPNSTDSPGLFVFDPGKRIRFLLHSGVIEALVIFVFDPGISCKV